MWSDLLYRLRALFRRRAVEGELDDELRFHAEQYLRKSAAAGLSPEEAARRMRLESGGEAQIREACRDARGVSFLEDMGRDLHYAARVLGKSQGFAAVAVLILALGIGANSAAFSFVNTILLKKLPVERPDDLVLLQYTIRGRGPFDGMGYPDLRDLQQRNQVFSGMFGASSLVLNFTAGGTPLRAFGSLVSGDFFRTLGVHAALGRLLDRDDDGAEDAHPVCVISWEFWQQQFGGEVAALNRVVQLDAHPFQIVGVLQPGFRGVSLHRRSDVFVPMSMCEPFTGMKRDQPGYTWFEAMARLKPGVSRAQAAGAFEVLLRRKYPGRTGLLAPGAQGEGSDRERLASPALISLGAVAAVLLIACANLAGLLLARTSARRHELAVRLSLGATRRRLVRQLMMECALLAAAGCAASLAVSEILMKLLIHFLEAPDSADAMLVRLDPLVLAFTATLTLVTLLIFGLLPAWQATKLNAGAGLQNRPGTFAHGAARLRQALIVIQLALGVVLLFGAGVLTRTLRQLQTADLGFNPERVISVNVDPGKSGYTQAAAGDLYQNLLFQARRLPAVESAALCEIGVLSGDMFAGMVRIPGYIPHRDEPNNNYNVVSAGYFRTLGIPLTAGRDFTDRDRAGAPAVAIVNEEFVKHYWPGQPAVGRHFGVTWARDVEIVGVVKTARYRAVREAPQITIYIPVLQKPIYPLTLHARTRANSEFAIAQIRSVIRAIDPKLPVTATTLLDLRDVTISRERLLAFLSSFLAILAAALVAIGLYGLIAYSVAARTREIGVRLALGARPTAVTWMFVRQALLMALLGIVIGLPPALGCARFLERIVFGVPAQDPIAAIAGCLILGLIAAAAALWPAGKGARQDPMKALRYE